MARKSSPLTVNYHARALEALKQIWNWNAVHYDQGHADSYIVFLKQATDNLADMYHSRAGRPVPTRPEFRYITIRRSSRGHGHVAIYRVMDKEVQVMEFFHTAQDWQAHIEGNDYRFDAE